MKKRGFTVIELLLVIAIIGVIASLAVVMVREAKGKSQNAKAAADLKAFQTAIAILQADTGKWPNGCPPESTANPEIFLDQPQAGLVAQPAIGDQGGGCTWTAEDLAKWKGPYVSVTKDPWGHPYYFDPDYSIYLNCPAQTPEALTVAVLSFGATGYPTTLYDCDDVFLRLK